ncbi:hypothetical protein BURPSPAST_Z0590 [Burkholderia pseudomallei Pasteur 52237]|nr:hypothetical protein BURPSPAST_Z0590 [Burkholderia pseudomallei Pasteur 52237]
MITLSFAPRCEDDARTPAFSAFEPPPARPCPRAFEHARESRSPV